MEEKKPTREVPPVLKKRGIEKVVFVNNPPPFDARLFVDLFRPEIEEMLRMGVLNSKN